MAICGRCGGSLIPGVDGYSCGSTGNPKNINEILWYHMLCPGRESTGRCDDGAHNRYHGTCACDESIPCQHCQYCMVCEQYDLFSNTPNIERSVRVVGRILDGGQI